ncbi:GyrI-like domain-containing protein, partial [Hydrogenophaga sp.]|uniref:AraC family transcriptional regulator n=1 Tax=Hydrogenophaga sp. TaxID=1904254 RepID=UPI0035691359
MNLSHGWTDYQQRLGRVIAYLHDHLHEPLDLHRLAEVAHLSPYHWHRVYHALHGETIAVTVRRLRLHRATGYLANSQLPVEQVARRCGYPNAQSFARAFRTAYGMSPLQYRQHGGHTVFHRAAAQALAPGGYPVELREVPRLRLAGLDHKGSYMTIGKAFEGSFVQLAALDLVGPDSRW